MIANFWCVVKSFVCLEIVKVSGIMKGHLTIILNSILKEYKNNYVDIEQI